MKFVEGTLKKVANAIVICGFESYVCILLLRKNRSNIFFYYLNSLLIKTNGGGSVLVTLIFCITVGFLKNISGGGSDEVFCGEDSIDEV